MKKKNASDPKPESISKEWSSRLRRMIEYQREHSTDWQTNDRLLTGDTTGVEADGIPKQASAKSKGLAYAWGLVRSLTSEIYAQNPQVLVEPLNQELRQHGRIITRIVQSDMERMKVERVMNRAIRDSFPYGYGAVIEAVNNYVSVHVDEDGEEQPVLDGQHFHLRRIHPSDILFDPNGREYDLSDHRFIGIRFYPTITWLREEAERQKKKGVAWRLPDTLDETPESVPETKLGQNNMEKTQSSMGFGTSQETEPEYRQVAVIEIHDKIRRKIIYVLEATQFQMAEMPWPVQFNFEGRELYPVTLVYLNEPTTGFYPIPELRLIRPQLLELGNLARMMREDAAQKFRKIATLAEFVDPAQKAEIADMTKPNNLLAFDRHAIEEFFGEENVGRDFDVRKLVGVLDDIYVNRDHPARYAMVEQEIQSIIGYGPANRGGIPRVRSAREAMLIADANESRLQEKLSLVEESFRQVCEKHLMFLQQTQEVTRYARNFPEVAKLAPFFAYTRDQIKGEFAFSVYGGSSTPKNTDARKAQVREMFQIMGPILQQAQIDIRPLVEVVAKAHGWDEIDFLYRDVRKELLALAAVSFAVQQGQAQPQALLEAVARVVQTGLSEAELQALAQQLGGQQQGVAPPGMVPPEKPGMLRGDADALGTQAGVI